jgi:hypothetical protein
VRYELPRAEFARLTVYDVRGRAVRILDPGSARGERTVLPWDGRNADGWPLPAGVYFLRLAAESGERVRKLVIAP